MGADTQRAVRDIAPWRWVTLVMFAVAGMHAVWASGSSWPFASADALADTVVGRRPLPPAGATWVVVALLTSAGLAMLASAWLSQPEHRSMGNAHLLMAVCSVILNLAAFVLAMRGVLGFITSVSGIRGSTGRYRVLDVLVYSPLSLWLAAGIYFRPQSAVGRGVRPAAR